jgi:hypothetical protein
MRIGKSLIVLLSAAAIVPSLAGQTALVTGTAKLRNGTPLNGVRITVKNKDVVLVTTSTNTAGVYQAKAAFGTVSVVCEVESEDKPYARNWLSYDVEVTPKSNPGKQDCTFDQVTVAQDYWQQVGKSLSEKAAHADNKAIFYSKEWKEINASGLPPDAKAAAAHQLDKMDFGFSITDRTFTDYKSVDESTLTRALKGDGKAAASLPGTVRQDVQAYSIKDLIGGRERQKQ